MLSVVRLTTRFRVFRCEVPGHPPGIVDLVVCTGEGRLNSKPRKFSYSLPEVAGITETRFVEYLHLPNRFLPLTFSGICLGVKMSTFQPVTRIVNLRAKAPTFKCSCHPVGLYDSTTSTFSQCLKERMKCHFWDS